MTLLDDTITEYEENFSNRGDLHGSTSRESSVLYLAFCVNKATHFLEKILKRLDEMEELQKDMILQEKK